MIMESTINNDCSSLLVFRDGDEEQVVSQDPSLVDWAVGDSSCMILERRTMHHSLQQTRQRRRREFSCETLIRKHHSPGHDSPSYPIRKSNSKIAMQRRHRHTKLSRSNTSFQIVLLLLSSIQLLLLSPAIAQDNAPVPEAVPEAITMAQQEQPADMTDAESKAQNNPLNKFCGISYDEARQFCHLEAHKSLPCPSGEDDCPYNMPCWEIKESCSMTPTQGPTVGKPPSGSPITKRSGDASDHNFCGVGYNNLFGCGIKCPNGSPAECPTGQLCYFDTPCDARIEGGLLGDPTRSPTSAPTQKPTPTPPTLSPVNPIDLQIGKSNFCGSTVTEASENCNFVRHCPLGNNDECPEEMFCWTNVDGCDVNEFPTTRPTISVRPTPSPSYSPTTRDPSHTYAPTRSPLDKDDIRKYFFCGTSWGDATERCYMRCLSGGHEDCPGDEECFAQAGCKNGELKEPAELVLEEEEPGFSLSPDATPSPTTTETAMPSYSPIDKNDIRNYFFCGTNWMDASTRCHKRCTTSHHTECPGEEECFAQADCKKGVIIPKTSKPTTTPTAAPFAGTRSPTISPAPTDYPTEPQPTQSPLPPPTLAPNLAPSLAPTTPFPTNRPTFAPCAGDPCPNKEHCRSNQGYCGEGQNYCNAKSIWEASCGVPTDPPTSSHPTSSLPPSISPSMSTIPTRTQTNPPTGAPTLQSDLIYYLKTYPPTATKPDTPSNAIINGITNRPSMGKNNVEDDSIKTSSPTLGNVDDKYFAPDDPAGSFFCGKDWNHAITECPNRCPSGETEQCPNKMTCYAFTPCVGVGRVSTNPPTAKPTWEPTKKPTPKPTVMPTTAVQYWNEQNAQNAKDKPLEEQNSPQPPTRKPVWWTPIPSPRPTYSPTEDQCQGLPCDYQGECRSRLGFCGTGIVYCNSASVWVPSCGGGGTLIAGLEEEDTVKPNTVPSPAPTSSWQTWVANQNNSTGNTTLVSDAEDATAENSTTDETPVEKENSTTDETPVEKEEDTPADSGYSPDTWETWGSRAGETPANTDFRWWAQESSSATKRCSLLVSAVSWAMFVMLFYTH